MSLSAGEIVRLLKSDKDALRELAVAMASEPELRLAVINAVLVDIATKQDLQQIRQELKGEIAQLREELRGDITATKQDIQQLRQELRGEIAQLRQELRGEIAQLRREMNTNFRWTIGLIIGIWGTTVIPLLMKMAGVI
jgi:predicted  nucleic acid-binding Zn-ribbon protein